MNGHGTRNGVEADDVNEVGRVEPAELRRQLRLQLADRMNARPVGSWSPDLLRSLIAAFDLAGISPQQHSGRPELRLVSTGIDGRGCSDVG